MEGVLQINQSNKYPAEKLHFFTFLILKISEDKKKQLKPRKR